MPADHEAQSQVERKTAEVKALEEGLTRRTVRVAKFKIVGMAARVHDRERETRVTRTREDKHRATVTREAHVAACDTLST